MCISRQICALEGDAEAEDSEGGGPEEEIEDDDDDDDDEDDEEEEPKRGGRKSQSPMKTPAPKKQKTEVRKYLLPPHCPDPYFLTPH